MINFNERDFDGAKMKPTSGPMKMTKGEKVVC